MAVETLPVVENTLGDSRGEKKKTNSIRKTGSKRKNATSQAQADDLRSMTERKGPVETTRGGDRAEWTSRPSSVTQRLVILGQSLNLPVVRLSMGFSQLTQSTRWLAEVLLGHCHMV